MSQMGWDGMSQMGWGGMGWDGMGQSSAGREGAIWVKLVAVRSLAVDMPFARPLFAYFCRGVYRYGTYRGGRV